MARLRYRRVEDPSEAAPEKFEELAHVCQVPGGGAAFVGWLKQLKHDIGITGTLASDTGVVPRSGVTAAGDEPTVVSGFVPESSAGGAAVGSVLLTVLLIAFFFASTGALVAGVGVGVAAD